jgi:hypothetical protein
VLIILAICIGVYLSVIIYIEPYLDRALQIETREITRQIYNPDLKTATEFIEAVGFRESSGVWDTTNQYGMLGHFQFDPNTLKAIGINVSKKDFLENKQLQIGCFIQLLKENKKTYQKYITQYNYQRIRGVDGVITESGILMAFHLKPADAIRFFESGGRVGGLGDANGVKIKTYLEEFSGYELPF